MADDNRPILDPLPFTPVPGGGRPYQPMDLGRQIASSVAGSSIADQMVQDFVRQQNFTPTTRYDPMAPLIEEYRKGTAMRPVEQSFRGESFDTAFRGQAGPLDPQVVGVPDAIRQAERGFLSSWNESFFGTTMNRLMSYGTLYKAAQETTDPNYDEFNDPQIKAAGLDNQMHLFIGGGSAERTRLIIQHYQKRQQETAWLDRASGIAGWAGGAGALAASVAGDPTNFIPGSLGIKGMSLTMRGAKGVLTGPELPLLYGSKAVYGSIADGLRFASINAAAMIAERALVHSMDPTLSGEMTADIILPSIIAGSLGLYSGIAARRVARTLAEETRQNDGLLPLNAQRYGAPNQRGGIIREPDALHSGDFPPGSLATDYGNIRKAEMEADPYVASTSLRERADFGDFMKGSRVVDEQGRPQVVYHGTTKAYADYDMARVGETSGFAGHGGLWFTLDAETAGAYAMGEGGNIRPAYLRATNPKNITADIEQFPLPDPKNQQALFEHMDKTLTSINKAIERAKAEGHDAAVMNAADGLGRPTVQIVVFDPKQVRHFDQRYETRLADTARAARAGRIDHELPADASGSRELVLNGNSRSAAEFKTGHMFETPGGQVWRVNEVDGVKRFELWDKAPAAGEGSVGAALNPASQAYQRDVLLDQGRMAPSGLGIENWGLTPVARIFRGESVAAMDTTTKLVSTSGMQTRGNQLGIAQVGQPVEVLIQVNWNRPMVQVQRATQDAWTDYRRALANASQPAPPSVAGRGDSARVASQVGTAISDLVHSGEKGLSLAQFKERVGQVLRQGDADQLGDSASSYVSRAAAEHRKLYNVTKERALELGLFDEAHKEAIYAAQSELRALKKEANQIKIQAQKERWSPTQMRQAEEALLVRTEDAQFRFRQAESKLEELRANGPQLNGTAPSYAPRIYRVDKLMEGEADFVTRISDWLQSRHAHNGGQLAQPEAVRIAKEIHTLLSKQTPIYERGDQAALFKGVANPASVQARSLSIPDALIADFLEHDAEVLMRHHIKQMGTAIEMKEKFGSLDLADEIAEIEQEYRRQIIAANKGATEPTERAKELTAMMKGAIADVQALRDRLYGTYGASPDPQRWQSRTVRMAKQLSNLTLMGMSGITALGDLVRPLVTEGFDAFHGYGFRTLMNEQRSLILRLNREELEHWGLGMELQLNTRALSFADNGDIFAGRTAFERGMNQANSWMFVANGLNHVNQMDKELASLVIGGRVNKVFLDLVDTRGAVDTSKLNPRFATLSEAKIETSIAALEEKLAALQALPQRATRIERSQALRAEIVEHQVELAARGAQEPTGTLSAKDLGRFAAVGIDEAMARRIGLQIKIHKHSFDVGGKTLYLANSEAWGDKAAQQAYRGAMNQMTNRTVPTPGVGDTPLLMSTELGGLMTQYKSFAFGAMNRVLLSGLQEDGMKFWYGAGMMVASAALLNEVRSQLFYGKSTTDKPVPAIIADAVDRSSILGWFSDVDRAVTMLSGNSVGIKPMMGAASPVQPRFSQVAGAVGGPSAGQAVRLLNVANDALSGHPTAQTYRDWRNVFPGQNLPYMDPVMDMLFEKDGLMPSIFGTNKQDRRRPAGL